MLACLHSTIQESKLCLGRKQPKKVSAWLECLFTADTQLLAKRYEQIPFEERSPAKNIVMSLETYPIYFFYKQRKCVYQNQYFF